MNHPYDPNRLTLEALRETKRESLMRQMLLMFVLITSLSACADDSANLTRFTPPEATTSQEELSGLALKALKTAQPDAINVSAHWSSIEAREGYRVVGAGTVDGAKLNVVVNISRDLKVISYENTTSIDKEAPLTQSATQFLQLLSFHDFEAAHKIIDQRDVDVATFRREMVAAGFERVDLLKLKWESAVKGTQGYQLFGVAGQRAGKKKEELKLPFSLTLAQTNGAWRVTSAQSLRDVDSKAWVSPSATRFLAGLERGDLKGAYDAGDSLLQSNRSFEQFKADMERFGFQRLDLLSVKWINAVPAKEGYRLTGEVSLRAQDQEQARQIPFYLNLIGNEHLSAERRKGEIKPWKVLDLQSTESIFSRMSRGASTSLDSFVLVMIFGLIGAILFMILRYIRGLVGSPRELYLMFFTKLTEYSAYGAASYTFVLYLSNDVGLGDAGGAAYYTVFSLTMTITVMVVGAVCDTIGVKKTLLVGTFMLLTARLFMPLSTNVVFTTLFGFLPFALGVAITGPVLKVGIKMFTNTKTAALGFGLFYTLMNIGFAIGGWLFDYIRNIYGDGGTVVVPVLGLEISTYQAILGVGFFINIPDILAVLWMREGVEMTEDGIKITPAKKVDTDELDKSLRASWVTRMSQIRSELIMGTYLISIVSFIVSMKQGATLIAVISLLIFLITFATYWRLKLIRHRLQMPDDAEIEERYIKAQEYYFKMMLSVTITLLIAGAFLHPSLVFGKWTWATLVFTGLLSGGLTIYAILSMISLYTRGGFERVMHAVRGATEKTVEQLKENFSERPFWIYLFMLSILVFVRLTFFIFHVMFPTYGIRVFGEGAQVGSIFGVLNPILIVIFVPLISVLTANVRSYTMLLIGTALSAGAVFLCFIPDSIAISLSEGVLGELIYDYWLGVPIGQRDPFYISITIFIFFFTIGEAIWSPRLMQFSAEIAPKGKEGAYIALAVLPYFVGKALAGGMSGFLIERYTPSTFTSFPDHQLVWMWIGGMAMISPVGLVIFKRLFTQVERNAYSESTGDASSIELKAKSAESAESE